MIETPAKPLQFNSARPAESIGIQMAPLIDIVFLLNCFFLFATQLMKSQIDLAVQLPEMNNPKTITERPAELVVNLRQEGTLRVNGQNLTPAQLSAFVRQEHQRAVEEKAPLRLIIRADRRETFGRLADVLRACREAGMEVVVLRSQEVTPS